MMKQVPMKLILAAALTFAAGIVSATESQQKLLASIVEQENAGKLLAAMSRARTNYSLNEKNELARLTYARLMVKNGKPAEAIDLLKPLANQHGDDWRPWFWLGSAQLMMKQLDDAAWSMDEALAREGSRVSVWVQRAVIEQERGNPQAAANMLQVADSIEPGNIDVLVNYAYALERSGELEKSSAVYRRFLKASATNPEVGRLRSRVLSRLTSIQNLRQQHETTEKALSDEDSAADEADSGLSQSDDNDDESII